MLTISGSMNFDDGIDPATLLSHLADEIRAAKGRDITITGNTLSFRGGLFRWFVTNRNVLNAFGHGELTVDTARREVEYRLSIRQIVMLATAFVAFVLFFGGREIWGSPVMLLYPALGWLIIVGGNVLIGLPRFRYFLRKAVNSVPITTR